MSFKKLYEKMKRTPKAQRDLAFGNYECKGQRCIIGMMIPKPVLRKVDRKLLFENIDSQGTWKAFGPYVRKYGLTRDEAVRLQEINDNGPYGIWDRVFEYVKEQALKE